MNLIPDRIEIGRSDPHISWWRIGSNIALSDRLHPILNHHGGLQYDDPLHAPV